MHNDENSYQPLLDGRSAEIALMEQLGRELGNVQKRLGLIEDKLDDVRERVTRVEATSNDRQLARVEQVLENTILRIDNLERNHDRVNGMAAVGDWFSRSAPWLISAGAMVAALFSWLRNSPPS